MNKSVVKLLGLLIESTAVLEARPDEAVKDLLKRNKKAIAHAQGLVKKDAMRRDPWKGEPHVALIHMTYGEREIWGYRYGGLQATNPRWSRGDALTELHNASSRLRDNAPARLRLPIPDPIPVVRKDTPVEDVA